MVKTRLEHSSGKIFQVYPPLRLGLEEHLAEGKDVDAEAEVRDEPAEEVQRGDGQVAQRQKEGGVEEGEENTMLRTKPSRPAGPRSPRTRHIAQRRQGELLPSVSCRSSSRRRIARRAGPATSPPAPIFCLSRGGDVIRDREADEVGPELERFVMEAAPDGRHLLSRGQM